MKQKYKKETKGLLVCHDGKDVSLLMVVLSFVTDSGVFMQLGFSSLHHKVFAYTR